jgi:hypothetical protein
MHPMKAILVLLLGSVPSGAWAGAPFQFAAPGLRAPDDPHVNGIRFSVFTGRNQSVRGVDLGLFSLSETSDLTGFSSVLGVGRLSGDLLGCASGVVNIHHGRDRGLNAAFVNQVRTMAGGANVAVVNIVDDFSMVDLGAMNLSGRSTVQVGVLNITERIEGVQIGLLNLAENGFLPVFPFFNFPKN